MAPENVEVVRAHIEAYRARDTDLSASFLDEHVVRDLSRVGGLDPVAYGVAAVVEGTVDYRGAFDDYDYLVELRDLGSGQVLAEGAESGRGKGSGAQVEHAFAVLYSLLGEKIVRITAFPDTHAVLEAVGLSE